MRDLLNCLPTKEMICQSSFRHANRPNPEQFNKRKPIFNEAINTFDIISPKKILPSLEIKFQENNERRGYGDAIENKDFVYVALVEMLDHQNNFLSQLPNIIDAARQHEYIWRPGTRRTRKYYLFGKTMKELLIGINTTVQVHHEKDSCFNTRWPMDKECMSTEIEKQSILLINGADYEVTIWPNSRCVDCRTPINPLLELCELEQNKTQSKTFIRCSTCIYANEQAEIERLRLINNPKAARRNNRWQIYKEGDTKIHWKIVGELEKWICHLCQELVDHSLPSTHPLAPTVDHVIPITKGGKHEWDNVKLAHRSCNAKKSNNFDERQLVRS